MTETFIITVDHLKEERPLYGEVTADALDGAGWPFKIGAAQPEGWLPFGLYDDDNELYFEGYALEGDEESDGFIQAWEWGAWYAGCTAIKSGEEWIIT